MKEEDIFLGIFAYIEHLFSKIRPRKVFFLAIDGVAPRAKMNQQRSRRFRTAQEAKENVEKAIRRGEELPESPPFDSNCITPGTSFMRKLSQQLEYFVAKKVSEDSDWRGVEVILSGHEACGEGEHKIMEFIRTIKAQPGYNPNTRHCLYGLDADLIMLGLLSHDPHFALLREQVTFGPRRARRSVGVESQTFYLLHISLLREYLELEFASLRDKLPFAFDLEKIIDDYILLHLFVGNDFLPHLPGLQINDGAIELLFRVYEKVLPQAGGYLNEQGVLRPERLQLVINQLFQLERDRFVHQHMPQLEQKTKARRTRELKNYRVGAPKYIRRAHHNFVLNVKSLLVDFFADPKNAPWEFMVVVRPESDLVQFAQELAEKLDMVFYFEKDESYESPTDDAECYMSLKPSMIRQVRIPIPDSIDALEEKKKGMLATLESHLSLPIERKRHDPFASSRNQTLSEEESEREEQIAEEREREKEIDDALKEWKADYYHTKMGIKYNDPDAIQDIVYNYIEGMQWVLYYYYEGNASWGWFYRYHYAPQVSDLKNISDFTFQFNKGRPFLPFEQLMGVLPPLSKDLIPPAFQPLMTDPSSPILDFYPTKYESDMNGKKNSWEAVVKIPFIDEERLLHALQLREGGLTAEERQRNTLGVPLRFCYDNAFTRHVPSSLPGFLPDMPDNHTRILTYALPSMEGKSFVKTLPEGVHLGLDAMPGFPSIKTLPHTHMLRKYGVNVHGNASNDASMMLSVGRRDDQPDDLKSLADAMIGHTTYIHWPYLFEGLVVAVSDGSQEFRAHWQDADVVTRTTPAANMKTSFSKHEQSVLQYYGKRCGVLLHDVTALLHVRPLKGLSHGYDGSIMKQYEPSPEHEVVYPLPLMVNQVRRPDSRFLERAPMTVSEEFPDGTKVFFLGMPGFGCPARVIGSASELITVELAFLSDMAQEQAIIRKLVQQRATDTYFSSPAIAQQLHMSSLALAKLTSSITVLFKGQKLNIGLNLKFEAKSRKVLGYSRRTHLGWEFSARAVLLIKDVLDQFPELKSVLARRLGDGEFYKAEDVFPRDTDKRIAAVRAWQKEHGLRDLEDVPLNVDRLERPIISTLESAVSILANRRLESSGAIKRQILRGLPRGALLKPEQARYRVPEQTFELGDRVINVLDFGSIPLAAKGTVVGIGAKSIDVVFDAPFLTGHSLGGICSPYRGATLGLASVLNLSTPQIATRWGEQNEGQADLTPLQRTLKAQIHQQMTSPAPSKGSLFYQPAPPHAQSKPTASGHVSRASRSRAGIGATSATTTTTLSSKQGVSAATSHLASLSIRPPAPASNAWQRPPPRPAVPRSHAPDAAPSTKDGTRTTPGQTTRPATRGPSVRPPAGPRPPRPHAPRPPKAGSGPKGSSGTSNQPGQPVPRPPKTQNKGPSQRPPRGPKGAARKPPNAGP